MFSHTDATVQVRSTIVLPVHPQKLSSSAANTTTSCVCAGACVWGGGAHGPGRARAWRGQHCAGAGCPAPYARAVRCVRARRVCDVALVQPTRRCEAVGGWGWVGQCGRMAPWRCMGPAVCACRRCMHAPRPCALPLPARARWVALAFLLRLRGTPEGVSGLFIGGVWGAGGPPAMARAGLDGEPLAWAAVCSHRASGRCAAAGAATTASCFRFVFLWQECMDGWKVDG